ncbi:MAG: glutathione S-transferase family protein [Sneathiella sp.]|nr:glutathione S-transferase family protein [Sneathiella sp.]
MDMEQGAYIIYGSEYSPFSVKVRAYFRFKQIAHEWRPRTKENMSHFMEYAKLPLVPLVIGADGSTLQDSTPIMEKMEKKFPENSLYPPSQEAAFVSMMLEEYADEWVNKPMFHYRWWRDVDQIHVANALAGNMNPIATKAEKETQAAQIRKRMVSRLGFVGSSKQNKEIIENSLDQLLDLLETHLSNRSYLFGGRPAFADFGLFGQLYGCTQQPTSLKIMERYPNVMKWVQHMLHPHIEGDWEGWGDVSDTLIPVLKTQVSELYLPWATANTAALVKGLTEFTVTLNGSDFTQDSVKYVGRSFQALKTRFASIENRAPLEEILLKAGCMTPLIAENW